MATYIEEAIFIAKDEASKPIAAINKAIDNLNKAQAKLAASKDPFAASTRGASLSRSQLNALEKEYERVARAAASVGKQTNQAMRRSGIAAIREEEKAKLATEREIGKIGNQTTQAMHRIAMAAIKEEEAAKIASLKRIQNAASVAERQKAAEARQAIVEQNRLQREADATAKANARDARRAAAEQARLQERAIAAQNKADREQAREARNQARLLTQSANEKARLESQQARAEAVAQNKASRLAEQEARANAPRRRGLFYSQTGANGAGSRGGTGGGHGGDGGGNRGYHAYMPLGGPHMGGVGVSGLSLPGAVTIQAGANVAREVAGEVKNALVDYSNQKAMLTVEGLGKQVPEIDAMASRVAQVTPQLSKGEAIALFREQFAVFGDVKEAMRQTPAAAQRQAIIKAAVPNASGDTSIQFAKAGEELLGGALVSKNQSVKENALQMYNTMLDTWQKTFIEEKGQVSANDFNQMIKKSKGSLRSKYDINTPEGRSQMADEVGVQLPVLAATLGGAPTGTLLNSTSRAFNGRMTNAAKGEFEKAGLLDKSKVRTRDKKGNPDRVDYGWLPGADKSLLMYAMGPLHDSLQKQGILGDQKKRDFQIDRLFSNQVAAGAIKTVLNDYEKLEKALENVKRAQSRQEAYKTINEQDLGTSGRNVKGSVDTLGQTYLDPIIKPVASLFNTLAAGIGKLSQAGETNTTAKLAAGVGGVALAGAGAIGNYIYNNPGQAANTTALTVLTAAVSANTAAQASGLGGAVKTGIAATLATVATTAAVIGVDAAGLVDIYKHSSAGEGENEIERQKRYGIKPTPAGRLDINPIATQTPISSPNPFGSLGTQPKKDNFGLGGPVLDASAKLEPIAQAINSGATIFASASSQLPGKGSEFGTLAGDAMSNAITSAGSTAGAAMASAIAAAAANIQVNVNQKAAPNTGSPPPPE